MSLTKLINLSGSLFECLHDGIAIVDRQGKILYVNEANFRITGIPRDQLVGKPVQDAVPLSHVPQVLADGREMIGVQSQVNGHQVLSNIVPIMIQGRYEGVISVFRDLTEIKELTSRLEEAEGTIRSLVRQLEGIEGMEAVMAIGPGKAMAEVIRIARKAALVNSTVLLTGESGTGKEVLARLIHQLSPRKEKPFMAINCAAIPETLLESELFGYEDGAFTGARKGGRPGLVEMASGGTLFLDEIGDLSIPLQAKILRVIQEKQVMRVGDNVYQTVDVRIITATHQDLETMVRLKRFREDLFYRLRVIRIQVPPLRDRMEDLPEYVDFLSRRISARIGKAVPRLDRSVWQVLLAYDYPGNVRELENLLEVAMVLDEDGLITLEDLPDFEGIRELKLNSSKPATGINLQFSTLPTLAELETAFLTQAMEQIPSRKELSRILGIARSTLYRKMELMGLATEPEDMSE